MQAYQRRDLLEDEDAAIPQRAYVTEEEEETVSDAIARDPGTDIAGQSAQSDAAREQSRSGTFEGTIGTVVDAMPGSEVQTSNATQTGDARAADATSGGLPANAVQKQSDRDSLPTGKASGGGNQSFKAGSLTGREVMTSELPDDTAWRPTCRSCCTLA